MKVKKWGSRLWGFLWRTILRAFPNLILDELGQEKRFRQILPWACNGRKSLRVSKMDAEKESQLWRRRFLMVE
jgi:hypothetical protein